MSIKELLKRNKWIYWTNAYFKAHQMKNNSKKLLEYYERRFKEENVIYNRSRAITTFQKKTLDRGIDLAAISENPRIFWVGTNKDQDFSGFVQGLMNIGKVVCFTNRSGLYGLESSSKILDTEIIEHNSRLIVEQVKKAGNINVLIGQMLACRVSAEALSEIQRMGIVTINVSMDDRLPNLWIEKNGVIPGAAGLVRGLDLILTTSKECCVRYLLHGCPAIYWPLASDAELFQPSEKKDLDVCFVGSKYGMRGKIVKRLERDGISVNAFGPGWPNGSIAASEVARIFGRSRIILGIGTIGYSEDIYTLKLRDFDATMAGALYVTHRNPDLLEYFDEDKEIVCYRDLEELTIKVKYYLENAELVTDISEAARRKASTYHTWDKRFTELFSLFKYYI